MQTQPQTPAQTAASTLYLKECFLELNRRNPKFSLRAFAQKLGITPSGLSQIFSGKKRVSYERAHEFASRLHLSDADSEYFLLLVQADSTKKPALKSQLLERIGDRFPERLPQHNLSLDQFKLISEWYGIALLEIVSTFGRRWDAGRIADYLGIHKTEAESMLARLERLELIEVTPKGYRRVAERLHVSSNVPSDTIRAFYKNTLPKVQESIETQTPDEKIIGAEIFAFDPGQMDKAREITREYFQKMIQLASQGKNRTEVYQAFVNFYRMRKP